MIGVIFALMLSNCPIWTIFVEYKEYYSNKCEYCNNDSFETIRTIY